MINVELALLARALGATWRALWPRVRRLKEPSDTGRALSDDEVRRLIVAADELAAGKAVLRVKRNGAIHEQRLGPRGVLLPALIRMALHTGMRLSELLGLKWRHVSLTSGVIEIPGTKTQAARRVVPISEPLRTVIEEHQAWYRRRFGAAAPDWYLFPSGSPQPADPERPCTTVKHAWETVRKIAGVECRFHDLRHTFISRLAEAGVPELALMELVGHVSRSMLLRYSHARMEAKREAVNRLAFPDPLQDSPKVKLSVIPSTRRK